MENNLDSLFKTIGKKSPPSKQVNDILKHSKKRIKSICQVLCSSVNSYEPSKTVNAIKRYLDEKTNKERILYSEVSSFVYGLSLSEQGVFATNIECLISHALDEANNVTDNVCKFVLKLYDHFQLCVSQKNLNSETNDIVSARLVEKLDEAQKTAEEASKRAQSIEREYITILGIFASVILVFVGGLTFSTSVLQNINAVSILRLLFVIDLLAMVIVNSMYVLLNFIWHINNKEKKDSGNKFVRIKTFNIIFICFAILIVAAWFLDIVSMVEYISEKFKWSK